MDSPQGLPHVPHSSGPTEPRGSVSASGNQVPGENYPHDASGAVMPQFSPVQTAVEHQMKSLFSPEGLITLGVQFAVVVGIGLFSSLLVYLSLDGSSALGYLMPRDASLSLIPVLIGSLVGGGTVLSMSGFGMSADVTLLAFPWTVIIAEAIALRLVLNRRVWKDNTVRETFPTAVRSLVEGAIVASLVTVLTGFFVVGSSSNGLRANAFLPFGVVFVVVGVSNFISRQHAAQVEVTPVALRPVLGELRAVARVFIPVFAVVTAFVCVAGFIINDQASMIPLALLMLPNLTIAVIGLAFFGGISASGGISVGGFSGGTSSAVAAWDIGGFGLVIVVLGVLTALAASLSVGVQRKRVSALVWNRVWQLPAAVLVIMLVGFFLFNIRLFSSAGSGVVGMAGWSPLTITCAAVLVSILAEVTPKSLGVAAPGLLKLCAGSAATTWLASSEEYISHPGVSPQLGESQSPQILRNDAFAQGQRPIQPVAQPIQPVGQPVQPVGTPIQPAGQPIQPAGQPAQPVGQPAQPVGTPLVPVQQRQPMAPETKKKIRRIIGSCCAIAVLVIAGVVTLAILNGQRSPEARTREYLQLLAEGKAEAATAMVDPGIANSERTFLTDATMRNASARIEIQDVEEASSSSGMKGELRYVTATLSLDGKRFTHDFVLKAGKKAYGVLNNWEITEAFTVNVEVESTGVPAVQIGEVTKQLEKGRSYITVYPGTYTVSAANMSAYMVAKPVTLNTLDSQSITLKSTFSDDLQKEALDAIVAKVNSCGSTEKAGNLDLDCPSAVQSKTLSVLKVKEVPTTVEKDKYRSGQYIAQFAVITVQEDAPFQKDTSPRDIRYRVTAIVVTDDTSGAPVRDQQGKPQFTFSWQYANPLTSS